MKNAKYLISLLRGSYETTARPGAGISCGEGTGVPSLSKVIRSLVDDDRLAGDVDLSEEGGQVVAQLADHGTLRVGHDVPEVAHMSHS